MQITFKIYLKFKKEFFREQNSSKHFLESQLGIWFIPNSFMHIEIVLTATFFYRINCTEQAKPNEAIHLKLMIKSAPSTTKILRFEISMHEVSIR